MKFDGIKMFTKYADVYGDAINDTRIAEKFFTEFLEEIGGAVNVDYLDTDNDDRISAVDFDHTDGFLRICTRVPEKNPEIRMMRKMVMPFDTYSILVRLKSIRFVKVKDNKCIGIVVNGYTVHRKEIEQEVTKKGNKILNVNDKSSFFSTNLSLKVDGEYEFMRAMKTPITSFWIIPKDLFISPQDSESILYEYNVRSLIKRLSNSWAELTNRLNDTEDKEKQDDSIKVCGNKLRNIAEGLFKLVICFYLERDNIKFKEYNYMMLGDLINPLKKIVYTTEDDAIRLNKIERISNEFSHDTGLPVKITDVGELCLTLKYYLEDFKFKIGIRDNEEKPKLSTKPSPTDYIEKNLKSWNFSALLKDYPKSTKNCSFFLKFEPLFYTVGHSLPCTDYLCKDGFIRALDEKDISEAYEFTSREDVIDICTNITNFVKAKVAAVGTYDENLVYTGVTPQIIKKDKPTHLFTLEEIRTLMSNADDEKNNKLVIDENGFAHIVTDYHQGILYPVSQETWCAGNRYVGKDSDLSDAEPSYHLCLKLWLRYLQTGNRQYDDYYHRIDVDKTIKEINKFY